MYIILVCSVEKRKTIEGRQSSLNHGRRVRALCPGLKRTFAYSLTSLEREKKVLSAGVFVASLGYLKYFATVLSSRAAVLVVTLLHMRLESLSKSAVVLVGMSRLTGGSTIIGPSGGTCDE